MAAMRGRKAGSMAKKKTTMDMITDRQTKCTHDYVFRCKHKRIVMIMVDCAAVSKKDARWVAREIAEAVMRGLSCERLPHADAMRQLKVEHMGCADCREERANAR